MDNFVSRFRIRQEKNGGAWCPKAQISSEVREYLEIDLDEDHLVTWTETQGRWGNGQGQEFTEAFTVEYWRQSIGRWVEYKDSRDTKVCVSIEQKIKQIAILSTGNPINIWYLPTIRKIKN